jgi:hypothetical protein
MMRIYVRATNIALPDQARRHGIRRARFALGRFASRIRSVSIVLTDDNGPRGGADTSCRVRVTGRDGWTVTVSDVDHDVGRALTRALARTERAVDRLIDRQRGRDTSNQARRRAS